MLRHSLISIRCTARCRPKYSTSMPIMAISSSNLPNRSRWISSLPNRPLFRALRGHDPQRTAVVHSVSGRTFTYGNLVAEVIRAKERLTETTSGKPLAGERVAFLAENSFDYVVTLLSILASDAIALPLSPSFPPSELKYILDNSGALALLATEKYKNKAQQVLDTGLVKEPFLAIHEKVKAGANLTESIDLHDIQEAKGGMMLYTSGTTNRPKGVLLPDSALAAQAESLIQAWAYGPGDRLLHLLPLHHIHGTVNALLAPLFVGSSIEFMFPFNTDAVWNRLAAPYSDAEGQSKTNVTFLTAVPTIYNRLLSSFKDLPPSTQEAAKQAISPENLRLNISGSAALPTPVKAAWQELSGGNVLLERYGMTEVGMALSCGLDFADRVDGSVGWPLPSVETRLLDTDSNEIIEPGAEIDKEGRERVGEIQLRGPTIFREYWRNEKATREEFIESEDGKGPWFKTGDVAVRRNVEGAGQNPDQAWARGPMYFIQGRKSVDIIKSGGEKISALEVERELLSLPQISEAAVVAIPSDQWGQKVAAILVLNKEALSPPAAASRGTKPKKPWSVLDMRRALKDKLAPYKIPSEMKILEGGLPRNAMGKINKKALVKEVFGDEAS